LAIVLCVTAFIMIWRAGTAAAGSLFVSASYQGPALGVVMLDRCEGSGYSACPRLRVVDGSARYTVAVPGAGQGNGVLLLANGLLWAGRGSVIDRSGDLGRRWREIHLPGQLLAWTAQSTGAWAITRSCRHGVRCRTRLWHSFDAGRTWWYQTLPDAVREAGPKDVFLLSFSNAANGVAVYPRDNGTHTIAITDDGGHAWSMHKSPCGEAYDMYEAVGTAADSVWVVCASEPGTGDQGHEVFVSDDAGVIFTLRNQAPFLERDKIGRGLFGAGYLGDIVPASSQTAFLSLDGDLGDLLRTDDGGRTWRTLRGFPEGDHSGLGAPSVSANGTDVWEPVLEIGLFASSDGGILWHNALP